jgi:hypothetical protein
MGYAGRGAETFHFPTRPHFAHPCYRSLNRGSRETASAFEACRAMPAASSAQCVCKAVSNTRRSGPPARAARSWRNVLENQREGASGRGLTVFPLDTVNRVNLPLSASISILRHSREGGNPGPQARRGLLWIPACAGMTRGGEWREGAGTPCGDIANLPRERQEAYSAGSTTSPAFAAAAPVALPKRRMPSSSGFSFMYLRSQT